MKRMRMERQMFMGLILTGFFCAWAALPARAEEWSKTYSLSGKPDLRVETSDANIHVSTWDQNTIEARVMTTGYKIGDGGIQIEEHQTGDVVEIDVRYPHPHGVTINWGNMAVIASRSTSTCRARAAWTCTPAMARLTSETLRARCSLRSGDGSQEIDGVDGKLRATTGDGHIRANGRFDELELKTGDGRLDARAATGSAWLPVGGWKAAMAQSRCRCRKTWRCDVDLHTGDGAHRSGYAGHHHGQDS